MGFHVGWITIFGKTPEEARSELELVETKKREDLPESEITAALLPSGWYMIFFNDLMAPELEDQRLKNLSQSGDVMMFLVEEASMVSLARGYVGGRCIWEVTHDSSGGLEDIKTSGVLPAPFPAIRDQQIKKLRKAGEYSADYLFDIPAELSKSITGFRHDEDIEGTDGEAFCILERVSQQPANPILMPSAMQSSEQPVAKKPWWQL